MKRKLAVAAGVLLACSCAFAQTPEEQEIRRINRQLFQAILQHEANAAEQLIADDALFVDGNDTNQIGTEIKALLQARYSYLKDSLVGNVRVTGVKIDGQTAVVAGRVWVISRRNRNTQLNQVYAFTNVFMRRENKWQAIVLHIDQVRTY